jgi:uncharacterized lipoprotein YbaY/heat shock protein HslJ
MNEVPSMQGTQLTTLLRIVAAMLLAAMAAACGNQAPPNPEESAQTKMQKITGTVSYRERLALSNRAELEVTLADVSRQDVAATILARQVISDPGQVPIRFELEYRPGDIDERMSYSVRATIHDRGRLLFTTDTHTPVLTRGAGREAHLLLVGVQQAAVSPPAPTPEDSGMALQGMFRYMADAARFRDCRSGKSFPVAMEGAYIELERAYLNSGIEAGNEVMVKLRGRYLERPAMESNHNEIKLIVDKLENIDPQNTCAPTEHAELQDTYWKLLELDGKPVVTPEGMREAHMVLASAGSSARGHAGCNNFFGTFQATEDKLTFSALGSTMMACLTGMDTEKAFLQALGETTRFEISGQFLTLFADDHPLARLEAVYL